MRFDTIICDVCKKNITEEEHFWMNLNAEKFDLCEKCHNKVLGMLRRKPK